MRARFLQRRLSVSAPRMTVRSHVPIGWKIAAGAAVVVASIAAGATLSRSGVLRSVLGSPDPALDRATAAVRALQMERDALLQPTSRVTDTGRVMESATIKELGAQITRLEADNARLKEDVAFFEAATSDRTPAGAADTASGIAIRRFQVTRDAAGGGARYRILLTQDSRATREFAGSLQLAVTMLQDGKAVNMVLPRSGTDGSPAGLPAAGQPPGSASDSSFQVVFRSYKRLDGAFELPVGATLKSVQARILERGAVRVQQTVTLR